VPSTNPFRFPNSCGPCKPSAMGGRDFYMDGGDHRNRRHNKNAMRNSQRGVQRQQPHERHQPHERQQPHIAQLSTRDGGMNSARGRPHLEREAALRSEVSAQHGTLTVNDSIAGEHEFLEESSRYLASGDLANAAKIMLRLSRTDHAGKKLIKNPKFRETLALLHKELHTENRQIWPRELADLAFALGKLQLHDNNVNELLKRIAEIARYQVDLFTPRDLAGIVWGFASLCHRNDSLMSVVAAEVVNKISGFDQRQLSNTAWAFAKCGLWNEQLVKSITGECMTKIETFSAQSLSHIAWAMAHWGAPRRDDLMDAIAVELQKKISEFMPAPLAMIAWSFASLQLKNIPLMNAISSEAASKVRQFRMQDLAHLAWAFANVRIRDQALFNILADEIQRNIAGTQPAELANIAWAFSKNNFSHEPLMLAIASEAIPQIHDLKPAELAMLTWAFAIAGQPHKQLMMEIGSQVASRIEKCSTPQLSHITWAFGALSIRHGDFLQSLAKHVHANVGKFRAQSLAGFVWTFAMVRFCDEPLLRRVIPEIARDTADLRPVVLARCAWAYRVLGLLSSELMAALVLEALNKIDAFSTQVLVKLVDSVSICPGTKHAVLETALEKRMADVANFLKETWKTAELPAGVSVHDYSTKLLSFGLGDGGIIGTPLLLAQLGIELPSKSFVQRCRPKAWMACKEEATKSHLENDRKKATVAEVCVTAMDRNLHDWVVRCVSTGSRAAADRGDASRKPEGSQEEFSQGFLAVALPGRSGREDAVFLALADVCTRIFELGVDPGSPTACAGVHGSVQVLSTAVPDVSSVSVLRQFTARFPGVTLEFAEMAGAISD